MNRPNPAILPSDALRPIPEPIREEIDAFRAELEKRGRAPKTISSYSCAVRLFYRQFELPDTESLLAWRNWLLNSYRFNTVNSRIYGMNQYLNYLSPDDPFRLRPVKTQKKNYLDNVISRRDYERLKRRLKKDDNLYWYFVVRFLGSTGARISELLQLKIENLQIGYLDLYSKGGKMRRIYFPRSLCEEALPYFTGRGVDSGFLFLNRQGNLITPRGIELHLKKLAVLYRINPATVYPHSFRHRFAKNFLSRFNDIALLADLMGHDSIETTRLYLTRSSSEQRELIDRIVTW